MSNEEFVEFCYQIILGRGSDQEGKQNYVKALEEGRLKREDILLLFSSSEEYKNKLAACEFVPPGHFYSAIPSAHDRSSFLKDRAKNNKVPGINLNEKKQLNMLQLFKKFYDECPFPEKKTEQYRYYFLNPAYTYTDALALYCMVRYLRPGKIIEIGSGYSSCLMLDTNDLFFKGEIDITFIEPYPDLLFSLLNKDEKKNHKIITKPIQDVDLEVFGELNENDILLIDSTHVSKLFSDVNKIIFEILPALHKNVVIHFHDIFWPFEYPDDWIREGRAWNEAYLLRAFLQYNDNFEILFFSSYLHAKYSDWFHKNMPLYLKNTGGSLWLRKTKADLSL